MTHLAMQQLSAIVGEDKLLQDPAECVAYSYDNSCYQAMPEAVVLPADAEQVMQIVKVCNEHHMPLYPRGKGTGTTGACVPLHGGIVLSLEQMNRIINVDYANRVMTVEPGVTNEQVQLTAAKQGFFWAPNPSSASTCSVGGNLACNAAGPRAVKYGSCRENTLGLTAVTGTGDLMHTGVYTTKGVVGYDLTRLLIGSEGSLAIITQATLKLLPLCPHKITLQACYQDLDHCTTAIVNIMAQPLSPCTLEFMDQGSINMIRNDVSVNIPDNTAAILLIEVDGLVQQQDASADNIIAAASNPGLLDIKVANTADEVQALWHMRKILSPALRQIAPKKINEDVVVPVSAIPEFIAYTQQLAQQYNIIIVNFGHAGNGNIHVNLMIDPNDSAQQKNASLCLEKIFEKVLSLKGTLSGEHGIGVDKRQAIAKELDPHALVMMHGIKKVFDPNGILNPGKVLPELGENKEHTAVVM